MACVCVYVCVTANLELWENVNMEFRKYKHRTRFFGEIADTKLISHR